MKLALHKGFRTLKFLHSPHNAATRALCGAALYSLALVSTGRHRLAAEVAVRCWQHDDFELSLRRCSWYLRRGWLRLTLSQGDLFDVTPKLLHPQLSSLDGFLAARKHTIDPAIFAVEHAYIRARQLKTLPAGSDRAPYGEAFAAACNRLLNLNADTPLPAPVGGAHKRRFKIESAKSALHDLTILFPTDKVPWFVISGTFLGLVREKGFLPHDYDIDIGVFADQVDAQDLQQAIARNPAFYLSKFDDHRPGSGHGAATPSLMKLVHASGILIDLFIHQKDTTTTPATYWHGSSLHRWRNTAFDLAPYDFYGDVVLGPADADRYLTENYGDWRTPVVDFNCTTDTPNLKLAPNPVSVVTLLKRYVAHKHQGTPEEDANASRLKSTLLENGFLTETPSGETTVGTNLFSETA